MSTVLLDEHLGGYARYIYSLAFCDFWKEIATAISLRFVELDEVGLKTGDSDKIVWRYCQAHGLYLLTDNRSQLTDDSLGSVIQFESTADSVPVFTIGDVNRFRDDRRYAEDLVEQLIEYLFEPTLIRGTGRLFLP